jgi:predicted dehydrogenase
MKNIKLGILGMSEGNGHPYSWSAIFNGYNMEYMKDCPFPVIPKYLSKQKFPEDQIQGARVTHIWTQNRTISEHIAKASNIENIVDDPTYLINSVDAILLARDDYKMHYKMAKPFIDAGIPIYIDKPISTTIKEMNKIFSLEKYNGQIFTCSALQYAKEFVLNKNDEEYLGKLKYVDACIRGPWDKYSIHIIEPVLKIIGEQGNVVTSSRSKSINNVHLKCQYESGLITSFSTFLNSPSPLVIRVWGEKGFKELKFEDTYNSFKSSLKEFLLSINNPKYNSSKRFSQKTIKILELGK